MWRNIPWRYFWKIWTFKKFLELPSNANYKCLRLSRILNCCDKLLYSSINKYIHLTKPTFSKIIHYLSSLMFPFCVLVPRLYHVRNRNEFIKISVMSKRDTFNINLCKTITSNKKNPTLKKPFPRLKGKSI